MVKDVCRMGSSNRAVEGFLVQQVPLVCLFGELSSRTLFQVLTNRFGLGSALVRWWLLASLPWHCQLLVL